MGLTECDARMSVDSSLRIAAVVPPWFHVPPEGYGGIEAMCATLIDALVARGHHVTVVGAGEPGTRAQEFVQVFAQPRNERLAVSDHACVYVAHVELIYSASVRHVLAELDVDIVHDHSLGGPLLAGTRPVPTVVTAHVLEGTELPTYYAALEDTIGMVAISDAQRRRAPELPWVGTVHNAVQADAFPLATAKDDFVLFLGRISAEKGPALAIDAARGAGRPIVMAGKCNDPDERAHFEEFIRPRLGPDVHWFGEADERAKKDLLARASSLVFPVQWEEPFGLVMLEAMACGTPVVALRRGAVPEIVVDGVTGFVCDEPADLAGAIEKASILDPAACRGHVESAFDPAAMAAGYERIYGEVLDGRGRVAAGSSTWERGCA